VAEATGQGKAVRTWDSPHMLNILAGWCVIGAAIIALIGLARTPQPNQLQGGFVWSVMLSLFGLFWLGAQMLRLSSVWQSLKPALAMQARQRSEEDMLRIEHGLIEFFVYLAMSLVTLAVVAYGASGGGHLGAMPVHIVGEDTRTLHLTVFLIFFGMSFLPLLIGFWRQAHLDAHLRSDGTRKVQVLRTDVVSDASFWMSAILIASLVLLAWAAAGEMFTMEEDFGVFITLLVLLLFFVIILAPHVMRFHNTWSEERDIARDKMHFAGLSLVSPGAWVSRLDSVLVRFVAPLSGATQHGPVWFIPHLLGLMVILPLSALGYVLAAPWGLIPILTAMLIAVSLGRRWAWVEEDRETASRLRSTRSDEISIGFDNDLKDEALLGYASLFILVPLALHQLQGWTHSFVEVEQWSSGNKFLDWLRFFGAELAKAVPFVDWWEIYNVDIQTPFDAANSDNPLAKHLTFAARAMVDLVIMAALFQAIGLWQRSRTQNRLYDSGQLDTFDPFTEVAFFENGMRWHSDEKAMKPKRRFAIRVREHVSHRTRLKMEPMPYSQERLSELMNSPNRDVSSGARWMIREFNVLAGTPRDQLEQISERLANEAAETLHHSIKDRSYARTYKNELERILQELIDDYRSFQAGDVRHLVLILMSVQGVPEFSYAQLLAVELLMMRPSRRSYLALAMLVLDGQHFKAPLGERYKAQFETYFDAYNSAYLEQLQMRNDVYSAMEFHASSMIKQETLFNDIRVFLEWMSEPDNSQPGRRGDKSKKSREVAYACANRLGRLKDAAGRLV